MYKCLECIHRGHAYLAYMHRVPHAPSRVTCRDTQCMYIKNAYKSGLYIVLGVHKFYVCISSMYKCPECIQRGLAYMHRVHTCPEHSDMQRHNVCISGMHTLYA